MLEWNNLNDHALFVRDARIIGEMDTHGFFCRIRSLEKTVKIPAFDNCDIIQGKNLLQNGVQVFNRNFIESLQSYLAFNISFNNIINFQ